LSPLMILRTPTDIFPNINIPVVAVAWQYTGLNPEEVEGRLTTPFEKTATTLVDNIEHIESTTYNGQSVIKIFLQSGASLDTANKDTEMSAVISDRANPVNFDTRLKSAGQSRNVS
jgi:multidrug efflux pump subunit AcrB